MRRTKIVATVGPASRDEATLARLVEAGVDVFRLNFSHGSHQEHGATIAAIRRIAAQTGRAVAVLQDLQGPRIRTGAMAGGKSMQLVPGGSLTLTTDQVDGAAGRVSVSYRGLPGEVRQMLGNKITGRRCLDGLEHGTNVRCPIRFHVKRVDVTHPAPGKQDDAGFCFTETTISATLFGGGRCAGG